MMSWMADRRSTSLSTVTVAFPLPHGLNTVQTQIYEYLLELIVIAHDRRYGC